MVALINRFCGLYPSPLSPACKYMQIPEEWVEPKAWWASTWTGLTSLLTFPRAILPRSQGAGTLERSRDPRPADLGSNPSPTSLPCAIHPGRVSSSQGRGVPTAPRGYVDLEPQEAGASQPELTVLLQWPPSLESPHHPFLRLQEKRAFSLGLQPGRARAPWKESCDFLNE